MIPVCVPASLPKDLDAASKEYSRNGCYVIALASRPCPEVDVKALAQTERKALESNLTFQGLLLLRNEVPLLSLPSLPHPILSSSPMRVRRSSPSSVGAFTPSCSRATTSTRPSTLPAPVA